MSAFNPTSRCDNVEKRKRKKKPSSQPLKSHWHLSKGALTKRKIIRVLLCCEHAVLSLVYITLHVGQRRRLEKNKNEKKKKTTRNHISHFSKLTFKSCLAEALMENSLTTQLKRNLKMILSEVHINPHLENFVKKNAWAIFRYLSKPQC